ncbi:hypothetical protein GLOIN_2v1559454 [Rhizophagus irregularis DAOM 181602=DAOM 197198]|uniref:Uncharacterized protein n=1 Tax=Rhizophagus irregularis (strain DAOM 181602 / DAOM 197198 / MUCL 43194) TaxID=747089 RepID=A0A2P4QEI4_RHIID|nr:hypothetical protein GLOIN_2v1559454 [Rhizophagus irregularis DAOM 181602=DAOM 197198]POG76030.1 hypothetical protein GLOIN_2v1559454 [Rhizophagus irregularis DAOM 181602=DAOM 197198]|eukprot:XP_025182896.1 hypothetical protein GLOIN_2v1559454 [Rhizophagus irregularis DAOM 181602=DAOM 197198]
MLNEFNAFWSIFAKQKFLSSKTFNESLCIYSDLKIQSSIFSTLGKLGESNLLILFDNIK